MRLEQSRRPVLRLITGRVLSSAAIRRFALSAALGALLSLATALPIAAAPVSTMTGESFSRTSGTEQTSGACSPFSFPLPLSFSVPSYTAFGGTTGPYPGTFTETGVIDTTAKLFQATFSISSGGTTVTGSHAISGKGIGFGCDAFHGGVSADVTQAPYTATIHTPSGNYHDEGVSDVFAAAGWPFVGFRLSESFASSLAQPIPMVIYVCNLTRQFVTDAVMATGMCAVLNAAKLYQDRGVPSGKAGELAAYERMVQAALRSHFLTAQQADILTNAADEV